MTKKIRAQEKILIRDDGLVRVLKKETVRALEESRNRRDKMKSFNSLEEAMKELDCGVTQKSKK